MQLRVGKSDGGAAHPIAGSPDATARLSNSSNTLPILTGLRAKVVALCESRWAMALPAIALAGQSAAICFMDSGRQTLPTLGRAREASVPTAG